MPRQIIRNAQPHELTHATTLADDGLLDQAVVRDVVAEAANFRISLLSVTSDYDALAKIDHDTRKAGKFYPGGRVQTDEMPDFMTSVVGLIAGQTAQPDRIRTAAYLAMPTRSKELVNPPGIDLRLSAKLGGPMTKLLVVRDNGSLETDDDGRVVASKTTNYISGRLSLGNVGLTMPVRRLEQGKVITEPTYQRLEFGPVQNENSPRMIFIDMMLERDNYFVGGIDVRAENTDNTSSR